MNAKDTNPGIAKLSHPPAGGGKASVDAGGMSYLDFLNKLIAAGTNLPLALPHISQGVTDFTAGAKEFEQAALVLANGEVPPMPIRVGLVDNIQKDEATERAEQHVIRILRGYSDHPKMPKEFGAMLGDANSSASILELIQQAFAFLKANPQLLQFLMSLLFPTPTPTPIHP
jgi:hypothetical protein